MISKRNPSQLRRILIAALTIAVMVSMSGLTAGPAFAADPQTVTAGGTITAGGTYQIASDAKDGTITVSTKEAVTLTGSGIDKAANTNLNIKCTESGTKLTIRDLYISNTSTTAPTLDFTGQENTFTFDDTSTIDKDTDATGYALIHVNQDTSLTISGKDANDTLYLYKREQGAGIGGNTGEANGSITFEQGNLFIKGSKQGAVIGCGANAGKKAAGAITINGGTLNVIGIARGAGIGGSAGSGGAADGTVVRVNGGLINVNVDWTGAAIGGGGYNNGNDADGGTIVYKAGSIRTFIDQNAITSWNVNQAGVHNNKAITASVKNAEGSDLALLSFDTSKLDQENQTGTYTVKEGSATLYSGKRHQYTYVNENTEKDGQQAITSTPTNWKDNLADANLYLYLTKANHTLNVNGEIWTASWNQDTSSFDLTKVTYGDNGFNDAGTMYNKSAETYTVTTAAQLQTIAAAVSAGDPLKGKTIRLDADLALTGTDWIPAGDAEHHFEGTFDGQGHTIRDMKVSTSSGYSGLFGYNAGTIKNLTVSGTVTDTSSNDFVGGIAAFNCGTIENIISDVTVNAGNCYNVGGIAGLSTSGYWVKKSGSSDALQKIEDATGLITKCTVNANVTGLNKVGGIVGENAGTVSKSSTSGKIDGTNASSKNGVGGIAGRNGNNNTAMETGIIDSCYSTATVGRGGQKWVGGMAGFNNGTYGCSAKTNEDGTRTYYFTFNGTQVTKEPSTIKNSYFAGTLSGTGYTNPIAGNQEGTAENCYSLEGILATGKSEAETGIKVSADELKSAAMPARLNDAFAVDLNSENHGYPVLTYRLSESDQNIAALAADIAAIDTENLTLEDTDTVKALLDRVAALTEEQQAKLTNLKLDTALSSAENKIVSLVKSTLRALPAADKITASDQNAIQTARAAYDKLTEDQKDAVGYTAAKKLEAAESALNALAPNAVKAQIHALPPADKITTSDKAAIQAARAAYNKLTEDQKDAVGYTATTKLVTAEVTLAAQEAKTQAAVKAFRAKKVTIKKAKAGKKKATITWKKRNGASGYQIVYGTNKNMTKGKRTLTVKKASTTKKVVKKLKTGKRYYFKVRAYKSINGEKVYTHYSKVKSAKVK